MAHEKFVDEYLGGVADIAKKISKSDIDKAIQVLYEAWKNDKAVYVIGNEAQGSCRI